jgi:hypothetical protein
MPNYRLNLRQDIDVYHGLQTINGYTTARTDATPKAIQSVNFLNLTLILL